MNRISCAIIDDESFNIEIIKEFITKQSNNFEIVGIADSVKSGCKLLNERRPEVIFLDIKMTDGNAFDLLNHFEEIFFEVVFISGFDNYALKAFEFNALDFLVKPIDVEKFVKTLEKVRIRIEQKYFQSESIKTTLATYDKRRLIIEKIPIHNKNKVFLLEITEITSVKTDDGYTVFSLITGEKFKSSRHLADFDFILAKHYFMVKISKGTYININFIVSYSKGISCLVFLKDGTEFEISRRKKAEVLEILQSNHFR